MQLAYLIIEQKKIIRITSMTPAICKECIDDNHLIRFILNQGLQHLGAHFTPMHKVVLLKYCGI